MLLTGSACLTQSHGTVMNNSTLITLDQILATIHQHRPMSRAGVYRYMAALDIRPAGAHQKPQRYPGNTPHRILAHLGFIPAESNGQKLASMNQLKKEKRGAK